jgi:ATP phosphoribosyltransferase
VREFLNEAGVADYQLVDSQGATEGTVKNETAEMVADITSTGETLRANHLKLLSDGLVLKSQATLWRSREADYGPQEKKTLKDLLALIEKAV